MIGLMPTTAVGASNDLTVTLVDSTTLGTTFGGTFYQVPSVTFGPAIVDREIFVVVSLNNNTGPVVVGGTIGGVTAQVVSNRYGLLWAPVPTGTSGTVRVDMSQSSTTGSMAVFSVSKRRVPNAPPISSTTQGTGFVTSFSINNTYPINSVGLFGAIAIAQSGTTAPNTTLNAPYTKVARQTGSGFESYTGYLLPKTTFSGARAFAGTFSITAALGSTLHIIQ
jgi:hypothetical protein